MPPRGWANGGSLTNSLHSVLFFLFRYLRKHFFPKHADLQFAGVYGVPKETGKPRGSTTFDESKYHVGKLNHDV